MRSTTITRSGQVNLVAPCSANHRRQSARSKASSAVHHGDDPLAEAVVGHRRRRRRGGPTGGPRGWPRRRRRRRSRPADDDVLQPAGDGDPALGVDRGPVAGAEPAVDEGGLGGFRIVIAGAQLGAADEELVALAESELDLARGPAIGVAAPLGRVVGVGRRHGGGLGRAVGPFHHGAEAFRGLVHEGRGDAGAARGDQAQRGDPLGREAVRRHQADEEGRGTDHERDVLGFDQVEGMLRIPLGHEHRPHAGGLRDEQAVEEAADVGQGRGHEDHVRGGQPVDVDHDVGLVAKGALGVQDALGLARRACGPQHAGDVGGPAGRGGGRALGQGIVGGEEHRRVDLGQEASRLGVAGLVVDRGGHRTQPPAGSVEGDHVGPVGPLPGHDVAPAHPERVEAAGRRGDALRRTEHVIQRGQVPRPTWRRPPVRLRVHERRPQAHGHRRFGIRSMGGRSGCASSPSGPRGGFRRAWPGGRSTRRRRPAGWT